MIYDEKGSRDKKIPKSVEGGESLKKRTRKSKQESKQVSKQASKQSKESKHGS